MSDELAEAERLVRLCIEERAVTVFFMNNLATVMAEYDRRGRVEKAAATLAEFWRVSPTVQDMSLDEMHELDQLLNDLWREMGSKP